MYIANSRAITKIIFKRSILDNAKGKNKVEFFEERKSLSCVWLFATPWTVAYLASPSMGFSRQEYRNGLPFPSPGDLPKPGIEPRWELDYKESWVLKNWCFSTVVLEKTLESPLHCKEIQPVHPKGNQFWILIGRTDAEAETPILWPPDAKSWLIWKDPDA